MSAKNHSLGPAEKVRRLFKKVWRQARRAEKDGTAEHVHDLRVAIRRSRRSLAVFGETLPERSVKKTRKGLHKILEKAAPLRDIDIVFDVMKAVHARPGRVLARELGAERARLRKELQQELAKFEQHHRAEKLKPVSGADASGTAPGIEALPAMAADYFRRGDGAADPATSWKSLHKFRLKTKKFRYTLELYANSYGPELRDWLKGLRSVQCHLGAISDFVTAMDLLKRWRDTDKVAADRALELIRPHMEKHARAFRQNWRDTFSPSQQRAWMKYVQGEKPAPRRPAAKAAEAWSAAPKIA